MTYTYRGDRLTADNQRDPAHCSPQVLVAPTLNAGAVCRWHGSECVGATVKEGEMMGWNEYCIEALKTAVYPQDIGLFYVLLKLMGEVVELEASVTLDDRDNLLKEAGDVAWYLAALQHELSLQDISTGWRWRRVLPANVTPQELIWQMYREIGNMQQSVAKAFRDNAGTLTDYQREGVEVVAEYLHHGLRLICKEHGFALEAVLAANIGKLTDRQQRGQIRGSGHGEERK